MNSPQDFSKKITPKHLKTGFDTERYRHQLLAAGRFKKLAATYSSKLPEIPDANSGKFWDERFSAKASQAHLMEQDRNRRVARWLIQHSLGKKILNLGAGSGLLEGLVYGQQADGFEWTGTDITTTTLKKMQKMYPKWQFEKQQLTKLVYPKKTFDVVLLLEVLEHIRPVHTLKVLDQISRVLRPDGTFIISVPINENLEAMFPQNPNSHLRVYSLELLEWELEQAGFTIEQVQPLTAFAQGYWWKSQLNALLKLRQPNNLVVWCQPVPKV